MVLVSQEIGSATGFLRSAAASYVNGQVLVVDGGFEATGVGRSTLCRAAPASASPPLCASPAPA